MNFDLSFHTWIRCHKTKYVYKTNVDVLLQVVEYVAFEFRVGAQFVVENDPLLNYGEIYLMYRFN